MKRLLNIWKQPAQMAAGNSDYLVIHGEWIYMFPPFMHGHDDLSDKLDELAQSVKFLPIERPVAHLAELLTETI